MGPKAAAAGVAVAATVVATENEGIQDEDDHKGGENDDDIPDESEQGEEGEGVKDEGRETEE
jgi:hypothetical protein